MDRLSAMQFFVRVAELGSFSEAAVAMDQSKSTVSKNVAWLEEQLGVRLINRTTRRLSLTEAGLGYLDRCRQILSDVEEAETAISQESAAPRGRLKVAAPMSFGYQHLAHHLAEFQQAYPDILLDFSMNDRYVDLIDEGYDVAIRIGGLADSSLIARRIIGSSVVTVASPEYLRRKGVPKVPADLAAHDCLIYRWPQPRDLWRYRNPDGSVEEVRVKGPLQVNNGDALAAAAAGGMGIVILPSFLVLSYMKAGALVPILCDFGHTAADIHVVYPHNRHLSTKVRVFVDFLVKTFAKRTEWEEPGTPGA